MISIDSVIALDNSFVTIDRLTLPQMLMGVEPTPLLKVLPSTSEGFLVETDSFSIITSPRQLFIISPEEVREAQNLTNEDAVFTAFGFETVRLVLPIYQNFNMVDLITQSRFLLSEGFYLISDN